MTGENVIEVEVERMGEARSRRERDLLAVEEPLEIRLHHIRHGQPARTTVSVTMRTPAQRTELRIERVVELAGDHLLPLGRHGTPLSARRRRM